MWKYELEYRIDKPETEGETDKHFDLDNYKDWLEEQLTNCGKQLSIHIVSKSEVFEHYGKPFTSGRDLWDFLTTNYNFTKKT